MIILLRVRIVKLESGGKRGLLLFGIIVLLHILLFMILRVVKGDMLLGLLRRGRGLLLLLVLESFSFERNCNYR
jgi:hypothetical protein